VRSYHHYQRDSGPAGGLDDLILERHYQQIVAHITAQWAGLVYIDCLVDILGDHDGHGHTQTRRAMRFLPRLAEDTGAVILATRHMKKTGEGAAWKGSIGSVGYTSRSRVTMQVYQDRGDDGRRILACALHRMGETPASLAFRLTGGDKASGVPAHVEWLGEDARSANQLAAEEAQTDREAPAKARAKAWLEQRLTGGGPADREMLFAEADAAGLSRSTVYNAAKDLGVAIEKERPTKFGGGWRSKWSLPSRTICAEPPPFVSTPSEFERMELSPSPVTPEHSSTPVVGRMGLVDGATHGINGAKPCPRCGNRDAIPDPAGGIACPRCEPTRYASAFKAGRAA